MACSSGLKFMKIANLQKDFFLCTRASYHWNNIFLNVRNILKVVINILFFGSYYSDKSLTSYFYRTYPADLKMRTYLRISELALEYGDAVEAESFVNRASMLLSEVKDEMLNIRFKVLFAQKLWCRCCFRNSAALSLYFI